MGGGNEISGRRAGAHLTVFVGASLADAQEPRALAAVKSTYITAQLATLCPPAGIHDEAVLAEREG